MELASRDHAAAADSQSTAAAATPTDPDTAQHYQYQTTPTTADIQNAVHTAKPAAVLAEPRAPQSTPTKPKAQAEQT